MMDCLKSDRKIIIGMVGLPARGKWESVKKRDEFAALAMEDMISFLKSGGDVAIYDGTNTTKKRRNWIRDYLESNLNNFDLIWVESICDEPETVEKNIRKAKVNNPDYIGDDPDKVVEDFFKRIANYENAYDPTSKEDYKGIRIIKIINLGKKVKLMNIEGYLQTKIASYLINLYPYPRPIYLIKAGFTNFLTEKMCGGDDVLNEQGIKFAKYLNSFFEKEVQTEFEFKQATQPIKILCSTLKRSFQTAEHIRLGVDPIRLKNLDQINFGIWDGLTEPEIEAKFPYQYQEMIKDSYRFRYPRGESYRDLVQRIIPVIFEIERSQTPVIIVAHLSTLRCIYAYFTKNEITDMPFLDIPYNSLIKLIPEVYFCEEKRFIFDMKTGAFMENKNISILELSPKLKKIKSEVNEVENFGGG